ncbi:hypothetical protein Tco_0151492 [Tanacetum coccineum]
MQSPFSQSPPKGSSQTEGEHIKKDKGKKALSLKEGVKESTESDSDDDETHQSGSIVKSSRIKKVKKFDFVTEDGKHIHLTKEQINQQKKIEEEAKAEAIKRESKVRKEELIDLLGPEVVNKYYNDKLRYERYCDKMLNRRAVSKITNCDVLTRKGPVILKVYIKDGTSEIIPNFKASTRIDYIHTTKAELGINLDIPLSKQDPLDKLNDLANKRRKHADDIHDYFKAYKRLKSSVQYKDHLPRIVLNEPVLEIFFILHQGPGLDDHVLLAEIDKRNLNPLKQMRVIEQLRQYNLELLKLLQRRLFRSLEDWEVSSHQYERKATNLDQRLKSLIMSVLLDDQMNSVINCLTAKSTWDDLILYHEGPSDVKESRVMDLKLCYNTFKFKEGESLTQTFTRYKALMNELVNEDIKLSKLEINTSFINGLPKKWLTYSESLRNTNHVKDFELASLFGKHKYEENLIDSFHETEKSKSLVSTTPLSTAFLTTSIDKEEVLSNDNEVTEVKALMELAVEERVSVGKESANNCEWVKISIQKAHTLLEIEDNNDRNSFLDYLCIDLNYVEEQRNNLLSKHRNLIHELNTCKEQLLVLKQAKLDLLTMQHVNTEILKENQKLRNELKELTSITEAWLNSSNKFNQCISEQIPTQKRKILGINQLTEDTSSSGPKDLVFVKSLADNSEVSITGSNKPKLSKTEDSTLSNPDTATDYDSADESSVCSTPFPPLEKLTGAEHVSGPKTIKSILKSKSTLKDEL